MGADIWDRVRGIADARGVPESEVFEQALERGLENLWRDVILTRYFTGELSREAAIDRLSRATVERAEPEPEVVQDDVEWGLIA